MFCRNCPPKFPEHQLYATFMLPLQCILQHHVANVHLSTHMATPDHNHHACSHSNENAKNYARRNTHSLQNAEEEPIMPGTTGAAPAAHRRCLSSPPATSLRVPPLHKPYAPFMQPLQSHHFPSSPLPLVTTS